jgi:hypothetical protein
MSYADDILKHYSFAPADLLKRLADALGEAESVASAPPKKQAGGAKTDPLKVGAQASESPRDFAAADTLLAMLEVSADTILCALAENTAKAENLSLGAARQLATERHPKVAARYLTEVRPDVALAAAADALMLSEDFTGDYGAAMSKALADDPALAKRYREDTFGAPDATPRAERPDVQLAEAADRIALSEGIPYGAAMSRALAEDPALAKRYQGA